MALPLQIGLPWGIELFILFTISGLLAGLWVYRDAKRLRVEHAALWGASVGFFFLFYFVAGIIAFVVYLVLRNTLRRNEPPLEKSGDIHHDTELVRSDE